MTFAPPGAFSANCPSRKAPRNFTLTRQMVGLKPPLPRSYSFFRFSTAFATVLLTLTFAANLIVPRLSLVRRSHVYDGWGGGYGGGPAESAAALKHPLQLRLLRPQLKLPSQPKLPLQRKLPLEMKPCPLQARPLRPKRDRQQMDTPPLKRQTARKQAGTSQNRRSNLKSRSEAPVPVAWQIALLVLGLVSG